MREKERERESTRVQLRSVPFRTVPRTEPIPYLLFLPSCNRLHDLIRAAHLACAQFSIDVSFSFSLLSFPSFPILSLFLSCCLFLSPTIIIICVCSLHVFIDGSNYLVRYKCTFSRGPSLLLLSLGNRYFVSLFRTKQSNDTL